VSVLDDVWLVDREGAARKPQIANASAASLRRRAPDGKRHATAVDAEPSAITSRSTVQHELKLERRAAAQRRTS